MNRGPDGTRRRRSWWSVIHAERAASDPGSQWTVEALRPLRRQTVACAALAFLGSTLLVLVLGGDEGVRQIVGIGLSGLHVLMVLGRLVVDLGARGLVPVLLILRAGWALLEVAAPLLRGAGLLAAAAGVLSILFSTYVFASARKTAPRADFQGGIR